MKDILTRIIYWCIYILGVFLLFRGHVNKRSNQILLGIGAIGLAIFIMHYPLSFVKDKGI